MIPNEATMNFALVHANDDVHQLALSGCASPDVDLKMALQLIQGRRAARTKLPSWASNNDIVYPPRLNMEQCSSEATALYKLSVIRNLRHKQSLLDLTGGFGVDFAFMSRAFEQAVYLERQEELCQMARHNFAALGLQGATVVCGDGVDYLHSMTASADMIFLDPARRDTHGSRTYAISDCTPDVIPLMETLLRKARYVMLKLSPMLDWRKAVADLGGHSVRQVHIVAISGECKELLILLSAEGTAQPPVLFCANDDTLEVFPTALTTPTAPPIPTAPTTPTIPTAPTPSHFLYEPNAALMKAGLFAELAARYGVQPLAANSHLFVSDTEVPSFPGRRFVVQAVSTMNKRELRRLTASVSQANITVRNFPMTVAELRRRLKMGEGGSNYIFATTLASGEHVLLLCSKA
ncbi:MAG: RsmD family RNA methyltransferase [Prevotella sp.]|nr:RsmD family RNA methyltransferase [Prevotella sp.]